MRLFVVLSALLFLSACSSNNMNDLLPDRRPDYRQSRSGNALEVPPDLTRSNIEEQLLIPDFNPSAVATYSDYMDDQVTRNQYGYLDVLPDLSGVEVIEQPDYMPYILAHSDANTAWANVKKYWLNNGIRISHEDPAIGVMETDWLEDISDLPKTGLNRLTSFLNVLHDNGERDRYRIRFSKIKPDLTQITVFYSKSEETELDDGVQGASQQEVKVFAWKLSENNDPERQLEMTRRLALFLSAQYRRAHQDAQPQAEQSKAIQSKLLDLPDGTPALSFKSSYDQAWRVLAIGLDNAGFRMEEQDYQQGRYVVQYIPNNGVSSKKKPGFWKRAFSRKARQEAKRHQEPLEGPRYAVRLADQGEECITVVETPQGAKPSTAESRSVLESIAAYL